jgi:GxxExxY protein
VQEETLTGQVIGCAMKVHCALGPGFVESVYQNALAHELRRTGLPLEVQKSVKVRYGGVVVGDFVVDLLVAGRVLVENKAVRALGKDHEVQLVNYLTATGIEIGLLLNFGASSLEVKRKYRTYRSTAEEKEDRQD